MSGWATSAAPRMGPSGRPSCAGSGDLQHADPARVARHSKKWHFMAFTVTWVPDTRLIFRQWNLNSQKGICLEFEFQNGYTRCGETKKKQKRTNRWGRRGEIYVICRTLFFAKTFWRKILPIIFFSSWAICFRASRKDTRARAAFACMFCKRRFVCCGFDVGLVWV